MLYYVSAQNAVEVHVCINGLYPTSQHICSSACDQYLQKSAKYSSCDMCLDESYDGGTCFDLQTQKCSGSESASAVVIGAQTQ